jgi:ribosomal protein S18 acetylase RimI-like enzyme
LLKAIQNNESSRFIICNTGKIYDSLIAELKSFGFLPVMVWPGMIIQTSAYNLETDINPLIEIAEVRDSETLKHWIDIVNKTLFQSRGISESLLSETLNSSEVYLLIAYYNKQPAGTLLAHVWNSTLGIYMVSTLPEYRQKGCMKSLMSRSHSLAIEKKCEHIVLEANNASYRGYKRLGFEHVSDYTIFWKT